MLVSENGNVSARTTLTNNKISNVEFSDNANKFFADYQEMLKERTDPSRVASDAKFL